MPAGMGREILTCIKRIIYDAPDSSTLLCAIVHVAKENDNKRHCTYMNIVEIVIAC
jgi:hypothetical protein